MIIKINKNLDKYKESVVAGLTARQVIHIIICAGVSVGIVFGLHKFIGFTLSSLICFPIVAVIALNGFSQNTMKQLRARLNLMFNARSVTYNSESESEKVIESFYKEKEFEEKMEKKKEKGGVSRFFNLAKFKKTKGGTDKK